MLFNVARTHLPLLSYVLVGLVWIWALVQATWLKFAYAASRAANWYVGAFLLFALLKVLEYFQGPAVFLGDSWIETVLVLGASCCYIAGTCYFAGEWREFVQHSQGYEPPINYAWAILLGVYYFQYKLHEVYELQRVRLTELPHDEQKPRAS